MSSAFCVSENVDELKTAFKQKTIFASSLKNSTLLMIFEILWNIGKRKSKCKQCFSKKTLRGLKKFKSIIKILLKKDKSLEKRKKIFMKGPSSFKTFIKKLLKQFLRNCTEPEEENQSDNGKV